MDQLVSALGILVFAIILAIAIIAIIRGYKGIKNSKQFDPGAKGAKIGYCILSGVHMTVGIIITLCYIIAILLVLTNL